MCCAPGEGVKVADWISFWNSDHPIYVNARHRDVHYRGIADDVSGYVTAGAAVLDYGCGEAVHADRVAARAGRLILCEAAPTVREHLTARFSSAGNIDVQSPEQAAALPAGSLDLIVMHSVAQYLSEQETDALFGEFRRLLKPGGLFILGDVIPPQVSPVADAAALLRFAAANGFLIAACMGLVRTTFSDYPKLRAKLGLTLYEEMAMAKKLEAAGFAVERAQKNIGHSRARITFLARPR
jgi:SAM-dependent methyltransferase